MLKMVHKSMTTTTWETTDYGQLRKGDIFIDDQGNTLKFSCYNLDEASGTQKPVYEPVFLAQVVAARRKEENDDVELASG